MERGDRVEFRQVPPDDLDVEDYDVDDDGLVIHRGTVKSMQGELAVVSWEDGMRSSTKRDYLRVI